MFAFLRGERELLSTFQQELYARTAQVLDDHGLRYRVERTYMGSGRAGVGRKYGDLQSMTTQYQIFVKRADYEEARAIARL